MIKLTYKHEHSRIGGEHSAYLLESITNSTPDSVQFIFSDVQRATLILGDRKYKITGGICTVELGELTEGIHFPRVAIGCELIAATAFMREGTEIKRAPLDEGVYERLRLTLAVLETEVTALREEVAYLGEQIRGKSLLNFDQT